MSEHPTPTCPQCGNERTRPLDREYAVCFDCDTEWEMSAGTQDVVADHFETSA
jgi:ribosomal protein L37AE/L43A